MALTVERIEEIMTDGTRRRDFIAEIESRGPAGIVVRCHNCAAEIYRMKESFDPDRIVGYMLKRTDFYRKNNWPAMPKDAIGDNVCCPDCGSVFFLPGQLYAALVLDGEVLDGKGAVAAIRVYRERRRQIEDKARAEEAHQAEMETELRDADRGMMAGLSEAAARWEEQKAEMEEMESSVTPLGEEIGSLRELSAFICAFEALTTLMYPASPELERTQTGSNEPDPDFVAVSARRAARPKETWRETYEAIPALRERWKNYLSMKAAYQRALKEGKVNE